MRAVWYEKKGPAREVLILGEKPTPAPAPGEVLIRVYASGVNPSDEGMRSGLGRSNVEPFVIPQSDGAGIVEALATVSPATRWATGSGSTTANARAANTAQGPSLSRSTRSASVPCPKRSPSAKGQLSVFPV